MLPYSKKRLREFTTTFKENNKLFQLDVTCRYDDSLNNGRQTFSITGNLYQVFKNRTIHVSSGCLHDVIFVKMRKLKHLVKWHNCSEKEPIHYLANTLYWMQQYHQTNDPLCLHHARTSAIAPTATVEQLSSMQWLVNRLPVLMAEFHYEMFNFFSEV